MYFLFYLKIKICLQASETFVFLCDMQIPFHGWLFNVYTMPLQNSGVPLFTICRMNDLRSEFNSRNSVCNASPFTALKISGIVLYCWRKAFIWFKLSKSLLQPTLVVINLIIYMKKLLDSDWLRAVQFKCNTSAKSVTPVQKV